MTTPSLLDGIHPALRRDKYDAINRVNFSTLKYIGKSPAHYKDMFDHPLPDSAPLRFGRALHIATFEPEDLTTKVCCWVGGTRRGKEWEAFKTSNADKEILTDTEHKACLAMREQIFASPIARKYITGGAAELSLGWQIQVADKVMPCKGRFDYVQPAAVVELKTTRDASPKSFGQQSFFYNYHTQAAWYLDAYEHVTGKVLPYYIIAVEKQSPFVVQVYRVPEAAIRVGRATYMQWLDLLQYCRESGTWPAYAECELDLTLPAWAFDEEDELSFAPEEDDAEDEA